MDLLQELLLHEVTDGDGAYLVADARLCGIAVRIAEAVEQLWPTYTGTQAHIRSLKYVPVLYKAAQLADSWGQSPEQFATQQLAGMARLSKFWLKSLASEKYRDTQPKEEDLNLLQLRLYKSQLAVFMSRCKLYGPLLAIKDRANEFTVLFRYVLATEYGLLDIADQLHGGACLEWASSPAAQNLFQNPINDRDGLQQRAHQHSAGPDATQPSDTGRGS